MAFIAEHLVVLVALVAAAMVTGMLRVLTVEYAIAVARHDLTAKVKRLRHQQQMRLDRMRRGEPVGPTLSAPPE